MGSVEMERIEKLFSLAEQRAVEGRGYRRLLEIAESISESHNVSLPGDSERKFCDSCKTFLLNGKGRIRLRPGTGLVYTCLECGEVSRYGYEA